jgi:hypothetical protein
MIIVGNDSGLQISNDAEFMVGLDPMFYWNDNINQYCMQTLSNYFTFANPSPGVPAFNMLEWNEPNNTYRKNSDTILTTGSVGANVDLGSYQFALGTGYFGEGSGQNSLQGPIAEVIIYNKILSSTERQSLETYITGRYGISIAGE